MGTHKTTTTNTDAPLGLYCAECGARIHYSLIDHWKLVHWPKVHKLYRMQYLYERDVRKVIKEEL